MTDFAARLLARTQGTAPVLAPRAPPRFAPTPHEPEAFFPAPPMAASDTPDWRPSARRVPDGSEAVVARTHETPGHRMHEQPQPVAGSRAAPPDERPREEQDRQPGDGPARETPSQNQPLHLNSAPDPDASAGPPLHGPRKLPPDPVHRAPSAVAPEAHASAAATSAAATSPQAASPEAASPAAERPGSEAAPAMPVLSPPESAEFFTPFLLDDVQERTAADRQASASLATSMATSIATSIATSGPVSNSGRTVGSHHAGAPAGTAPRPPSAAPMVPAPMVPAPMVSGPVIIEIGAVEFRAVAPPAAHVAPARPGASLTLDAYLQRRAGGPAAR